MRIVRREPDRRSTPLGIVFGAVLAIGAAMAAIWIRLGFPRPVCQLREWTGLACPTCGSTRLVESLLAGDVSAAIGWNPLVFFGLAAVAVWAVMSAVRVAFGLPVWRVEFAPRERLALRVLAVAGLAANWIWVLNGTWR